MTADDEITQFMVDMISQPPGLPKPNPTSARWQDPPHPTVSNMQSPELPTETDIVIIGSGITGCSVAYNILHNEAAAGLRITVLEARNTCSGATGRNGGHLVSDVHGEHDNTAELLERGETETIIRFSEASIARMKDLVAGLSEADREAAELRVVNSTMGYADAGVLEQAKKNTALVEEKIPNLTLKHMSIGEEDAKKEFKYREVVGGLGQLGAGVLWPYRLITGIFRNLLDEYSDRFSLETNTPVTGIDYDSARSTYTVKTPRGSISAKKVIHCTNGWTGHLNPNLVGKLYPWRGTMSAQKPGPSFPRLGDKFAWSYLGKSSLDRETRIMNGGLYYAQQNAKTGDIFIGGEVSKLEDILTSDDSQIGATAKENISTVLPRLFDDVDEKPEVKVWSGIMGWTSDGMPLAGNLNSEMSGRDGAEEWIAAGFNGHGMNKCWLTGEAVARMAVGEEKPEWFPRSYVLTQERFEGMSAKTSAERLAEWF